MTLEKLVESIERYAEARAQMATVGAVSPDEALARGKEERLARGALNRWLARIEAGEAVTHG